MLSYDKDWSSVTTEDKWIFDAFKQRFFEERVVDQKANPISLNQNLIAHLPPFGRDGKPARKFRGEGHDLRIVTDKGLTLRYTYLPDSYREDQTIHTLDYETLLEASKHLRGKVKRKFSWLKS